MKYLLLADVHLGVHKSSDIWHDVVIDLFFDIQDKCINKGIKDIIILGDFFDTRKSVNVKTIHTAYDVSNIFSSSDITIHILVGNHDTYYKSQIKPSSLEIFKETDNIHIIDEPTVMDDILFVPWDTSFDGDAKYCFGHFDIIGFLMNQNYVAKDGLDPEVFNKFEKVISGHYHTPSNQGNITYLGAPYQLDFHDAGGKRGYYVFEDGELEFIEYTGAPRYIIMSSEDEPKDIEGNIIKIKFTKDYGHNKNNDIIDKVSSMNPQQLHVDFSKTQGEEVEEEHNVSILEHKDIIREYVMNSEPPSHIKKDIVLNMINKMLKEEE